MRRFLFLPELKSREDLAYLFLRVLTGCFLVYGVWDNIISYDKMREFVGFMRANGFPLPEVLAPFSVYTQFLAGLGLIFGLFTRWSGVIIAITFIVAIVMVHWNQSFREWWPAAVLVGLGFLFASRGSGRYGSDKFLER